MSYELATLVYRKKIGNATLKGILGYIAHRTNDEHLEFYMSKRNIAEALELSERQIVRLMNKLVQCGLLTERGYHPTHKTKVYIFEADYIQTLPDILPAYVRRSVYQSEGGDNLSGGDICDTQGVTNATKGGDTMSPNRKNKKKKKGEQWRTSLFDRLDAHCTCGATERGLKQLIYEAEAYDGRRVLVTSPYAFDKINEALSRPLRAAGLILTRKKSEMTEMTDA